MAGVVAAVKPLATDGVALLCPFGCCQTCALIVQKSLCGRGAFYWRHARPSVTRIPIDPRFLTVGRQLGSWLETGVGEVGQIGNDKSAWVDRYGHRRQARLN
jgi:hypothetical protein